MTLTFRNKTNCKQAGRDISVPDEGKMRGRAAPPGYISAVKGKKNRVGAAVAVRLVKY